MTDPRRRVRPLTVALALTLVAVASGALLLRPWDDAGLGEATAAARRTDPFGPVRKGLALTRVARIDGQLTSITAIPGAPGMLALTTRDGRAFRMHASGTPGPALWFDLVATTRSDASERGLLSLAFPNDHATAGRLYINRIGPDGHTLVSRVTIDPATGAPDLANEERLLHIEQPAANHNGGHMIFDRDGALWIATGDGGAGGDPWDNAENPDTLLGKLLRIDVSTETGYRIPDGQPILQPPGLRPEIVAWGLRNPWRIAFDPTNGDLWIADVGQNRWEEVHLWKAGTPIGRHFGWDTLEGSHCFEPANDCDRAGKDMPVYSYGHDVGCSITGGVMLRGDRWGGLDGTYLFADFCAAAIGGLREGANGRVDSATLITDAGPITAFGTADTGEAFAVTLKGEVFAIRPTGTPR